MGKVTKRYPQGVCYEEGGKYYKMECDATDAAKHTATWTQYDTDKCDTKDPKKDEKFKVDDKCVVATKDKLHHRKAKCGAAQKIDSAITFKTYDNKDCTGTGVNTFPPHFIHMGFCERFATFDAEGKVGDNFGSRKWMVDTSAGSLNKTTWTKASDCKTASGGQETKADYICDNECRKLPDTETITGKTHYKLTGACSKPGSNSNSGNIDAAPGTAALSAGVLAFCLFLGLRTP